MSTLALTSQLLGQARPLVSSFVQMGQKVARPNVSSLCRNDISPDSFVTHPRKL